MKSALRIKTLVSALALGGLVSMAQAGVVKTDGSDIIVNTNGGFGVKTEDGQFSFNLEGRINWDTAVYDGVYNNSKKGEVASDTYIRRGYFGVTGTAYKNWYYEMILNMKGDQGSSSVEWDTFYLAYSGWDFATLTMGRARRPFGLEATTSSGWISTIERSAIWDLTNSEDTPSSALLMLSNGNNHMSWAVDVYDNGNETSDKADRHGYGGRVTFAPISEKTHVLHLGVSAADDHIVNGSSQSAQSRLGVYVADKQTFASGNFDSDTSVVLEAAYLNGPFSVQSEYLMRSLGGVGATKDADVSGYYLMAAYTLTGESRGYKAKSGKFDKIVPAKEGGAWELVARYDHVEGDQAGTVKTADVALVGLNWYANKNVKAMLNLQNTKTDKVVSTGADDSGTGVTARLQYNF